MSRPDATWVPYVGFGIGYAHIVNNIKFYANDVAIGGSQISSQVNKPAAQAILGINYFVDDFAAFGIDFRYFTTQKIDNFDSGLKIASVNFTVSGSFDCAWF
jgi:opacity protein-like surface antigen